MAIRQIREIGDEILTKQCKEVKKMSLRTRILIGDMLETGPSCSSIRRSLRRPANRPGKKDA